MNNIFMKRAIKLAKNGLFFVSNIPVFGYVIVRNNLIIIEDWMKINEYPSYNKKNNILLLQDSTIYLTLEPCINYNQLSFIDFILKYKISTVVIGIRNIYSHNTGLGIKLLQSSGVKVLENILGHECYEINKRIFTFYQKKRPFIILKWTQSLNGFIYKKNALNKQLTDKWRTEEEAIILDSRSILSGDSINNTYWYGKKPILIILDRKLIIPNDHLIYKYNNKIIVFTEQKQFAKNNIIFLRLKFDKNLSKKIIDKLYKKNIKSLMIEESTYIIKSFMKKEFWDEAKIYIHDIYLNNGIKVPNIIGKLIFKFSFYNAKIIIINSKKYYNMKL